jgi:hypothetical protein
MVQYIEHIFQQFVNVKFVAVVRCVGKNGSFGFAKGRLLFRAKPNLPFVRWVFCPLVFRLLSGQIGLHPTFGV